MKNAHNMGETMGTKEITKTEPNLPTFSSEQVDLIKRTICK